MRKIIAISFFALLFFSCKKDKDEINKLSNGDFTVVNFEPTFVAPLINTGTTLGEIYREVDTLVQKLENENNLKISVNSENLFVLSYGGSVETSDINDYYQIPDTSQSISLAIPQGVKSFIGSLNNGTTFENIWDTTFTFKLAPDFGAFLKEVKFNQGQIAMSFSHDLNQQLTAVATIKSLINDNTGDTLQFDFMNPGTKTEDITDHTANLFSNLLTGNDRYNRFEANIKISGTVIDNSILSGDSVKVGIDISNLGISYVEGFLGRFNANVPSDVIGFDIFTPEEVSGFHFRDPKLIFTPSSSAGLPFTFEIDTLDLGYDDGSSATLGLNGSTHNVLALDDVSQIPDSIISPDFIVDNTSQLDELLTSSPNKLIHAIDIISDPNGPNNFEFFLDERSKVRVDILAELPVDFSVENYNYRDTVDIDLSQLDDDVNAEDSVVLASFKNAALKIVFNNQLPVEAEVQGYFVDTTGAIIDSVFANGFETVFANDNVDADGIAQQAQDVITIVEIDKTKFENLTKTDKIVYIARASTSNSLSNAFGDVKLLSTYTFGLRIGVLAEFSIDLNKELDLPNEQ